MIIWTTYDTACICRPTALEAIYRMTNRRAQCIRCILAATIEEG